MELLGERASQRCTMSGARYRSPLRRAVSVTNAVTGESLTVTSRGARTRQTEHADGTTTVEFTGHLLLVLFSSDVGGDGLTPTSTTLIAGRTVITIDENGVFTVESVSGKTTDICAAIAA